MLDKYETVLRDRVIGDMLYMTSNEKVAKWLDIPEEDVKPVLNKLIAKGVLTYLGRSKTGSHKFELLPVSERSETVPAPVVPIPAPEPRSGFIDPFKDGF